MIRYQVTRETENGYEWITEFDVCETIDNLEALVFYLSKDFKEGIDFKVDGKNIYLFVNENEGHSAVRSMIMLADSRANDDFKN